MHRYIISTSVVDCCLHLHFLSPGHGELASSGNFGPWSFVCLGK